MGSGSGASSGAPRSPFPADARGAMTALGQRRWLVPDGYLPSGGEDDLESHEAVCVLNTGGEDATVELVAYFEDREPLGPFRLVVAARRTRHTRLDQITTVAGEQIPRDVPYALAVVADRPVAVQYSRMDVRSPSLALMTTLAHAIPD
jgi:hypothetical protein